MTGRSGGWRRAAYTLYGRIPGGIRQRIVRALKPSFTVSVMPVITDDERSEILLVRHSYLRDWGFPGGLLDRGEPPAEAARREALEEVGVRIELVGEPAVVVRPDHQIVRVVWRARPAEGATASPPAPSPEIDECRWFPLAGLPTMLPEAIEALRALERAEGHRGDDTSGPSGD